MAGITRRFVNKIGYAAKLETLEKTVEANAAVLGSIYRLATIKEEAKVKGNDASEFSC